MILLLLLKKYIIFLKTAILWKMSKTSELTAAYIDEALSTHFLEVYLLKMTSKQVVQVITEIQNKRGGMDILYLRKLINVRFGIKTPEDFYQPLRDIPEDFYVWEWGFAHYISSASLEDLWVLMPVLEEDLKRSRCVGFY